MSESETRALFQQSGADVAGTVLACRDAVVVATKEGAILLLELQRPGGKMLPAIDFLRGYELQVGEVLPSVRGAALLL